MDRPTTLHPLVNKGTLDYELCATLHNAIWKLAWAGTAPDTCPYPPPTWWEHFNPPDTIASRLNPDLIEFFKRAYYYPDVAGFFYFLNALVPCDRLLDDSWLKDLGTDRLMFLHYATNFKCGDELGLVYDQIKAKAAFVPLFDHVSPVCENNYGWVPLEYVYSAYLEMVQEGKVEVLSPNGKWSRQSTHDDFGPFRLYDYTTKDVDKSVCALKRLLDSIDARRSMSDSDAEDTDEAILPWGDPSTLDAPDLRPGTFARDFCSQSAQLSPVKFRYIAPGIRMQSPQELTSSLLHFAPGTPHLLPPPLLLFRADYPSSSHLSPRVEHATNIFSKCLGYPAIPPGLYLSHLDGLNSVFGNGCRLVLPFGIGAAGWARLSDHEGMDVQDWSDDPQPRDVCDDLYQSGYTGCSPHREVQLHKVLNSWADRVEAGDWEIGRDGVCGGIEKFKEADTPEGWKKYWLPPSW